MQVETNVLLAPLTTFHLGGPARLFVRVQNEQDLQEALAFAEAQRAPIFVLGGGSNVLIGDEGWDGLVIKIELRGIDIEKTDTGAVLIAGAGEVWDDVVAYSTGEGLWGLENLSGVPGTVGGAVWGNIGAYGASVSQTAVWVEVFDRPSGVVRRIEAKDCEFGYRDSYFKQNASRYVLLRAAFALRSEPHADLSYKDLTNRFGDATPTLEALREAVLAIRREKFPDLSVEGSAGSFFKNPILPSAEADKLVAKYPTMPVFSLPEVADVKVPLGWLLDHVLNLKGFSVGSARLFEKQALVVVSNGHSSRDVEALASEVIRKIYDTFSITIEPEVQILKNK